MKLPHAALSCALVLAACAVEIDTEVQEIATGDYTLVRRGSEKCLDLKGGGTANGTVLQQWACNGGSNQKFQVQGAGGGKQKLVHTASGKCVDVAGNSTSNGTKIQLWSCTGGASQSFRIEASTSGTHRVKHATANKCIDVSGGSNSNGAKVQLWSCNDSSAQKWRFDSLGAPPPPTDPLPMQKWDDAVVTAYTFQDNSACNSTMTSSGRPLIPYVSVALPFRFIHGPGDGPFHLGDKIYVSFLAGRTMPNGQQHTGWVQIDDFCGDGGDDSYCFQYGHPNVDLYIGDWASSGMTCVAQNPGQWGSGYFSGPAGDGQEDTAVYFGPPPAGQFDSSYGGKAKGQGDCGDCDFGQTVQPRACWHYDPGDTNVEYCDCSNSNC